VVEHCIFPWYLKDNILRFWLRTSEESVIIYGCGWHWRKMSFFVNILLIQPLESFKNILPNLNHQLKNKYLAKNVTKGYYSVVTHVHLWHEFDNWLCKVSCCLHMYFLWRHHLPPDKSENDQDSDSDWFTYCIESIDMWLLALLFITQPVVFHLPNLLLTENFVYPTLLSSTPDHK
jgi:hypothetical protein